jgi:hypothetical protein
LLQSRINVLQIQKRCDKKELLTELLSLEELLLPDDTDFDAALFLP